MTTIAYDGKTLACDMQITTGGQKTKINKMFKIDEDSVCCFAGTVEDCLMLYECLGTDKELVKGDDFSASLVIFNSKLKKCYLIQEKMQYLEVLAQFSYGSGGQAALAAMVSGKNAVKSIEIASKCCCYTGMGIQAYNNKTKNIDEYDLT